MPYLSFLFMWFSKTLRKKPVFKTSVIFTLQRITPHDPFQYHGLIVFFSCLQIHSHRLKKAMPSPKMLKSLLIVDKK